MYVKHVCHRRKNVAALSVDCDANLSSGPTCLQGLLCFSYFDFEFCVSNGFKKKKKKSFVCSGYLEGEMENISAHGPKK